MRRRSLALAFCVVLLVAARVAAQQGTSEIGGRVADQQGGVLPGVAIVLTNEDTGVFREVVSEPDGSYFVSQMILEPGGDFGDCRARHNWVYDWDSETGPADRGGRL